MRDSSNLVNPSGTDVAALLAAALVVLALAWSAPATVSWIYDGTVPQAEAAIAGTVRLVSHREWSDPRQAYARPLRRHMPAGKAWWIGAAAAATTIVALVAGLWRRAEVAAAQSTLARRSYDLRGSRPRAWARPRDVAARVARKRRHGRFTLGTLDRRLVLSEPEEHVAVIAPTRAGKTTRCVIPWLLEHDGPAIVTSTKTDVLRTSIDWRRRLGEVTVWDPFGETSGSWTPLNGCEDWSYALRQAHWLADAVQEGDSELASYWRGEAARLLAPLLHAAAVEGAGMSSVMGWIDGQEAKRPVAALRSAEAHGAIAQLSGVLALDPRNRGTIYMSAGSLIAAYRYPEVQATSDQGITASEFLNGEPNTLYVVASSRQQRLLAPLVVALISSLLHSAAELSNATGPLEPTLRVLLDEAANIAPLRDLPVHLSQAAGHGIRIASFWQSVGQLEHRYGGAANDVLANSAVKLFMGPIGDGATRTHVQGLLGEEPIESTTIVQDSSGERSRSTTKSWQPKGMPAALQQLAQDRGLLFAGRMQPAVIRMAPWWKSRDIAGRGRKATVHRSFGGTAP
jgi:type IV secretion system protein VirD4